GQDPVRRAVPPAGQADHDLRPHELRGLLDDAASPSVDSAAELPPEGEPPGKGGGATATPLVHAWTISAANTASSDSAPSRVAGTGSPLRVTFHDSRCLANRAIISRAAAPVPFSDSSWISSRSPSEIASMVTSRPAYAVSLKSSRWPVPGGSNPVTTSSEWFRRQDRP